VEELALADALGPLDTSSDMDMGVLRGTLQRRVISCGIFFRGKNG